MNPRMRLILLLLGIVIVLCSLVALAYAFIPGVDMRDQATLAPTLFSPP
jgi:hypothetical protein